MRDRERKTLEREVREHRVRIEEVAKSLHDIEENLKQADAPEKLARQAAVLRLEMRGRSAAVAVGAAILGLDLA